MSTFSSSTKIESIRKLFTADTMLPLKSHKYSNTLLNVDPPPSDSGVDAIFKAPVSSFANTQFEYGSARYKVFYRITVDIPSTLAWWYPKSVYYWRQQIELLGPFRTTTKIYKSGKKIHLELFFDDYSEVMEFLGRLKMKHPTVQLSLEYGKHYF
jgi:hypothetical protein